MIKYESLILSKFKKFNLSPRNNQVELIDKILKAYIDENKKYVVLSSPTGTGKSIVAVVMSECLSELTNLPSSKKISHILMQSNVLAKQYHNTFSKFKDFIQVEGANNYTCSALNSTADNCMYSSFGEKKRQIGGCNSCIFKQVKETKLTYPHFITNYSYYLIGSIYKLPTVLDYRLITIFDEAHTINETFCSFMEVKISTFILKKIINMLKEETWGLKSKELQKLTDASNLIKRGKVTKHTYNTFLESTFNVMKDVLGKYNTLYNNAMEHEDFITALMYRQRASYINNHINKYNDFLSYKYKHVVDIDSDNVKISPIFIEKMFEKIESSDYCLFMSATIDSTFMQRTLTLPPNKVKFIQSEAVFSKYTKEVVFLNHTSYNYKSLKNQSTIQTMNDTIKSIVELHSNKNGIILTPSFYLTSIIGSYLKSKILPTITILEHKQGTPLKDILKTHISSTTPSILISPSLFEGIDLPDKLSEYQIMLKAPYLSLGDSRIKYIFDNYRDIYKTYALYRIIQGFGRSTRHENDYSITYCLDTNIKWLFYDKTNYWKSEFNVK